MRDTMMVAMLVGVVACFATCQVKETNARVEMERALLQAGYTRDRKGNVVKLP